MSKKKNNDEKKKISVEGHRFVDIGSLDDKTFKELRSSDDKSRRAKMISLLKSSWSQEDVLKISNISLSEEIMSMLTFVLGVPGAIFVSPIVFFLLYYGGFVKSAIALIIFLLFLTISKVSFSEEALASWPATAMLRYFSFKGIFHTILEKDKPYILVAPPHGVSSLLNSVALKLLLYRCFHLAIY